MRTNECNDEIKIVIHFSLLKLFILVLKNITSLSSSSEGCCKNFERSIHSSDCRLLGINQTNRKKSDKI